MMHELLRIHTRYILLTDPSYFSIEFFFEVIDHWFFGCVWTNSTNENLVNL